MNASIKTNELSFYNDFGILTLNAKQFDTGRIFVFNIMDNDEPFDLSNCTVYLRISKADGTQFQGHECCTIKDASIIINTAIGNGDQILAANGINQCELHINDENNIELTTWTFNIYVEKRVHNGENISSINSYDVLDNMIHMEKDRIESEQERKKNEEKRVLDEQQRILDEKTRQDNEDQRQKTFGSVLNEAKTYAATASLCAYMVKESEEKININTTTVSLCAYQVKEMEKSVKESEKNAKESELASKESEEIAAASAATASVCAYQVKEIEKSVKESEKNALDSKNKAATSEANADKYAKLSQSYAEGTENVVRPNDSEDNSKFYSDLAKKLTEEAQKLLDQAQKLVSAATAGAIIPIGTITFENLPEEPQVGYMYNISNAFVTDNRFADGAGIKYNPGANVYYTKDGQWDVMIGVQVTGVKGNAESTYRHGDVNLTAANIGAVTPAEIKSGAISCWGLGQGAEIAANADLNNMLTAGNYCCSDATASSTIKNKPLSGDTREPFIFKVIDDAGYSVQYYEGVYTQKIFRRSRMYSNGQWQGWLEYLDKHGADGITGNLGFADSGTGMRGIKGIMGGNDAWRVMGGATGSNAGYLEIATGDDGNEAIYVRQYGGGHVDAFDNLVRTAKLLDENGNTYFPGDIHAGRIIYSDYGAAMMSKMGEHISTLKDFVEYVMTPYVARSSAGNVALDTDFLGIGETGWLRFCATWQNAYDNSTYDIDLNVLLFMEKEKIYRVFIRGRGGNYNITRRDNIAFNDDGNIRAGTANLLWNGAAGELNKLNVRPFDGDANTTIGGNKAHGIYLQADLIDKCVRIGLDGWGAVGVNLANTAKTAQKATSDGDGNVIKDTYLKKADLIKDLQYIGTQSYDAYEGAGHIRFANADIAKNNYLVIVEGAPSNSSTTGSPDYGRIIFVMPDGRQTSSNFTLPVTLGSFYSGTTARFAIDKSTYQLIIKVNKGSYVWATAYALKK